MLSPLPSSLPVLGSFPGLYCLATVLGFNSKLCALALGGGVDIIRVTFCRTSCSIFTKIDSAPTLSEQEGWGRGRVEAKFPLARGT